MSPSKARSQDHHFLPRFYLQRWASGDPALLFEFKRRYKGVSARPTSPKGTGYAKDGYRLREDRQEHPNRVEEQFYQPIDTRAADALAALESGIGNADWSEPLRAGWSRFVMSLLMRMPADLKRLRASYTREFAYLTDEMRQRYQQRRQPHYPPTLEQAVEDLSPEAIEDSAMLLGTTLIENRKVGGALKAMTWASVDVSDARDRVLTSDRPVHRVGQLNDRKGRIILPIGPRRLFVAAGTATELDWLMKKGPDRLVARSNRAVTEAADEFVYAADEQPLELIRRHFGTGTDNSLLAEVIAHIESKRGPATRGA